MSAPNDGGAAFPVPSISWKEHGEDCVAIGASGMTLRDWLAGQALAGRNVAPRAYQNWDDMAADCYDIADAMLKAREGGK